MVRYFSEDIAFQFKRKRLISNWLKNVSFQEGKRLGDLSVIFCSDLYLLDVNRKYLQHDYFTDIITFDYSESGLLSGDLFISIDTVRTNAEYYQTSFEEELDRVIIHGLLHLIGYDDRTEEDQRLMRSKEDACLQMRSSVSV